MNSRFLLIILFCFPCDHAVARANEQQPSNEQQPFIQQQLFNQRHPFSQRRPLKLLMIGNSFSQNASRFLPEIAKAGKQDLLIGKAEISGAPMHQHWDSVAANLLDSNRGRPYNGRSLRQVLLSDDWDIISFQQSSLLSGDTSTYTPYARNLFDLIHQFCPAARIIIHQTWPYRQDARFFTRLSSSRSTTSSGEMWQASRAAYHTIASKLGIALVPVGDAFHKAMSDPRFLFANDSIFDPGKAVYPDLPHLETNSLHVGYTWQDESKLNFDPVHANDAGCYLAGLVWYGWLFGKNPRKIAFRPQGVDRKTAIFLKETAAKVLAESLAGR